MNTTIDTSIFDCFEILRNKLSIEHYDVIFFLLYLQSKGSLSIEKLQEAGFPQEVQHLAASFQDSLALLSTEELSSVIHILQGIAPEQLAQELPAVFDQQLHLLSQAQGRKGGEYLQPAALTDFIYLLLGDIKDKSVFNPFAGVGSMIHRLNKSNTIYAQELHPRTQALAQLRLLAQGSQAGLHGEDSLLNWPSQQQFDYILANPPFDRIDKTYEIKGIRHYEDFLVQKSLELLSDKGKALFIVSPRLLRESKAWKQALIQEDLVEMVISFPSGVLNHSNINFALLLLNKDKAHKGKIQLVNAEAFVVNKEKRQKSIDIQALYKAIQESNHRQSTRWVYNEEVLAQKGNLQVQRYFLPFIEGGVALENIISPLKIKREATSQAKVLSIKDLKDNPIEYHLSQEDISDRTLTKARRLAPLSQDCLLLSTIGTLRPTLWQQQEETIYTLELIQSFQIDEHQVYPPYLINELQADYVKEQVHCLSAGSILQRITLKDLLSVQIQLPSLEAQRIKVKSLEDIRLKIQALEAERDALLEQEKERAFNEFASLKHSLGRPRQNILSWSRVLNKFFTHQSKQLSPINQNFEQLFGKSLVEVTQMIGNDINYISELLEKGEKGLVLKQYPKTLTSLQDIQQVVNELSTKQCQLRRDIPTLSKDKGLVCNAALLRTLLDNILSNAEKHGFPTATAHDEIILEVIEQEEQLMLEIKNNGKPFPVNFDKAKFIQKYSTNDQLRGSGIGGYDIDRIAQYLGDSNWELLLNENQFYPVIFRFKFPIHSIH